VPRGVRASDCGVAIAANEAADASTASPYLSNQRSDQQTGNQLAMQKCFHRRVLCSTLNAQ
jgi:hypothetical protein